MVTSVAIFFAVTALCSAEIAQEDLQYLNGLPLDNLLRLKASLQRLVDTELENVTSTPAYVDNFGAQAMAMQAPIKRGDYEEDHLAYKKDHESKISHVFSMSVTTLAFLAFGGYLLCLIVQAIRAKQMYNFQMPGAAMPTQPATFLVSAGLKKKPQPQFASYGRRRRDARAEAMRRIDLPPEQMFSALLQLCEGYAKWSERYSDVKKCRTAGGVVTVRTKMKCL